MTHPDFILLYVADPLASAAFYGTLLGREPLEASPGFALFALDSGVMLGLWAQAGVEPAPATTAQGHCGGGSELAFSVANATQVDAMHASWQSLGLTIIQPPAQMDFGYTFTAVDPDQHRLRVFATGGGA